MLRGLVPVLTWPNLRCWANSKENIFIYCVGSIGSTAPKSLRIGNYIIEIWHLMVISQCIIQLPDSWCNSSLLGKIVSWKEITSTSYYKSGTILRNNAMRHQIITLFLNQKFTLIMWEENSNLHMWAKLYILSTISIWKKVLTKAIWADKNGLVSGRLACTSSKTEILNKKGI